LISSDGILVELDAAVVAGADLLAAVQQRRGEARVGAAQTDGRRTALGALRGEARQARDGFCDARVRQLADIFGRDRLDDAARLALRLDGAHDTGANARDDDFLEFRVVLRGGERRRGEHRCDGGGQSAAAARVTETVHGFPPWEVEAD
jgi:hypothetical protein